MVGIRESESLVELEVIIKALSTVTDSVALERLELPRNQEEPCTGVLDAVEDIQVAMVSVISTQAAMETQESHPTVSTCIDPQVKHIRLTSLKKQPWAMVTLLESIARGYLARMMTCGIHFLRPLSRLSLISLLISLMMN